MRNTALLLFILFCSSAKSQPRGIVIDGIVTYQERIDTTFSKPQLVNNGDILIRKDGEFIYFGINNGSTGSTNLVLAKGDSCIVLHISGSLGRAIYQKLAPDSFSVVKPILWVTRNPEAWDFTGLRWFRNGKWEPKTADEVQQGMQETLKQHGYIASTVDLGSFRDIEVALSRKRYRGFQLLIQYRKPLLDNNQLQTTMALYPYQSTINNQLVSFRTFIEGVPGTSLKLMLNTKDWYQVD